MASRIFPRCRSVHRKGYRYRARFVTHSSTATDEQLQKSIKTRSRSRVTSPVNTCKISLPFPSSKRVLFQPLRCVLELIATCQKPLHLPLNRTETAIPSASNECSQY